MTNSSETSAEVIDYSVESVSNMFIEWGWYWCNIVKGVGPSGRRMGVSSESTSISLLQIVRIIMIDVSLNVYVKTIGITI